MGVLLDHPCYFRIFLYKPSIFGLTPFSEAPKLLMNTTVIDVILAKAYRIRDVRFFSCHFWDVHTAELVHDISPFEQWLRLTPLLVDDFSRGLCYPI